MILLCFTLVTRYVLKRVFSLASLDLVLMQLLCFYVVTVVLLALVDFGFLPLEAFTSFWHQVESFPSKVFLFIFAGLGFTHVLHCEGDSDDAASRTSETTAEWLVRTSDRALAAALATGELTEREENKLVHAVHRLQQGKLIQLNRDNPATELLVQRLDFILSGVAEVLPAYLESEFNIPLHRLRGPRWEVFIAMCAVPREKRQFTDPCFGDYDPSSTPFFLSDALSSLHHHPPHDGMGSWCRPYGLSFSCRLFPRGG